MRKLLTLAAFGVALATAVPALADGVSVGVRTGGVTVQYRDYDRRGDWRQGRRWMDRSDVERRIYRAGYVRIYAFDRYDRYYRVRCVNRSGAIFVLTIDGYNGGIIRAQYVGRERYRRW